MMVSDEQTKKGKFNESLQSFFHNGKRKSIGICEIREEKLKNRQTYGKITINNQP